MNLCRVNKMLSEAAGVLMEMREGETVENEALRVHRYRTSFRVTDLANAGKRGKSVDEFALYDVDYVRDPKVLRLVEMFAKRLHSAKSFKMALTMAQGIVDEAKRLGSSYPKIETHQYRGVDVAPAGFKKIEINGPYVYIRADDEGFSVRNKQDLNNEPTCIAPSKGKKTAAKKFYQWAQSNQSKIKSMTFRDVLDAMKNSNIGYHYYCAMD